MRLGDGLLVYVAEPADAAERYAMFTEALARAHRGRIPFVLTGVLHVADTQERAWEQPGPALAYLESHLRGEQLTADDLRPGAFLIGSPDVVAERLADLYAAVPFDHYAFWGRMPGLTHEHARESLRLFTTHVMPRFAGINRSP